MIDTDSELLNIMRMYLSKKKFNPEFNNAGNIQNPSDMLHLTECENLTTEDTRLSNPPNTLRGTGWNRWEWLCQDPQERVLVPFDYEISTATTAAITTVLLSQHQKTQVTVSQHQVMNLSETKSQELRVFQQDHQASSGGH